MKSTLTFAVVPKLPPRLEPLRELAYNLWWCWTPEASVLFREIDPELWVAVHHNPVKLLRNVSQARLIAASENENFVQRSEQLAQRLKDYKNKPDRWFQKTYGNQAQDFQVAYFSAEFGVHEALPIYSGGLGILAGDHCKSASDLGLPFIACGLMYRVGYFKQRINKDGWQESESVLWDFSELPVSEVLAPNSSIPLKVRVELPGRSVTVKVWAATVGLIKIYLLDTDVEENSADDRRITRQLYGGDHEMRIKQEIVLGIGGVRALHAVGHTPKVFHMNEGHAAFLGLERIRMLHKNSNLNFHEALQVVASSSIFTTHTPVAAGNDAFSLDLLRTYFGEFVRELGITFDELLRIGRPWEGKDSDPFSMTILGLRLSRYANGVSALHGDVSREMWQCVWPNVPTHEIPITSITNGIHTQTWMCPEFRVLLEKYMGAVWEDNVQDEEVWKKVYTIPDEEIWDTHQKRKAKLIERVRHRVQRQRLREEESPQSISDAQKLLNPNVLTVGFARRFATYKRATLLLKHLDRLKAMLGNTERPIQFVFAGKAHPADEPGKRFLQQVYKASDTPELRNKIIFVEDYDIDLARYLVSGVDVWLNTPTRPLEASGTSGEKCPPNGGVNCSILDGWWCEGYNGKNGYAINPDIIASNPATQDEFDANALYTIIEQEIIPRYYERDERGLPRKWIAVMKESMATISPKFSTFRMVQEYAGRLYMPAFQGNGRIRENNFASARELAQWKQEIRNQWNAVKVVSVGWNPTQPQFQVGEEFTVEARISLGSLAPGNVAVEAYVAETTGKKLHIAAPLTLVTDEGNGVYLYKGIVKTLESGSYWFNVRIIPFHPSLTQKHELRLITWAGRTELDNAQVNQMREVAHV